jgi:SP family sugar:H+ symporter-like MFS transporter
MGLDFLWGSLLMIGMLFLLETPKYAFSKGDPARAKSIMARMLGVDEQHPVLQKEMRELQDKLNTEQHTAIVDEDKPWWSVFQSKEVCLRTLLAVGIMSFNQRTGANFLYYYGTTIFTTTGISNGYVIQIIISAVNVVSTVPGLYFAQKLSHRQCLIVGALWMSACFLVFSSVGQFSLDKTDPSTTPAAGGIMITATVLFIAAFASTWSPLSWGEASLVCPAHCRATCASIATACLWIWGFLLAFFTPIITASIQGGHR